jgi:plasmid stability protein
MSVRTTIDIPDELHAALRQRAAAEHTSIRSLITGAVESQFHAQPSRRVTAPLVGKKGKPAPGSPDRENPYDVLFA